MRGGEEVEEQGETREKEKVAVAQPPETGSVLQVSRSTRFCDQIVTLIAIHNVEKWFSNFLASDLFIFLKQKLPELYLKDKVDLKNVLEVQVYFITQNVEPLLTTK